MRTINDEGLNLIKSFEGIPDGDPTTVKLDAYLDPIGIWTIGWGHAIFIDNKPLKGAANKATARKLFPGGITKEEATTLLRADLIGACRGVESILKVPVTDNQFAALVSFTFNLGVGSLKKSTLLRLVNEKTFTKAAKEFSKWNKAGGKVLKGLVKRRAAEAALFSTS